MDSVPKAQANQPIVVTPEIRQLLHAFKETMPGAKDLCLHFVTDTCTYGEKCRKKHDVQLKANAKIILQKYNDNQ